MTVNDLIKKLEAFDKNALIDITVCVKSVDDSYNYKYTYFRKPPYKESVEIGVFKDGEMCKLSICGDNIEEE